MQKSIHFYIQALLLLIVFSFSSCNENSEKSDDSIDGVWESVGYGRMVKIEDGEFILADVTDISCIPVMSGKVSDFGDKLHSERDTLFLKDGINSYAFSKISDAPKACKEDISEEKQKDPIYNFEVLAATFKDHYAYFKERNIDWDAVYKTNRAKITSETTDAELFVIMYQMLDS